MSNNSSLGELGQDAISGYSTSFTSNYFLLSAAVIILYDYFLTLSLEISHIWSGKLNILKCLFLLNRYINLISIYDVALFLWNPASDKVCQGFYYTAQIANILAALAICGIFTLRTFAIYNKNWIVFYVLAIPSCILIASNIWMTVVETAVAFPIQLQIGPNSCDFVISSSGITRLNQISLSLLRLTKDTGSLISVVSSSIFDALVMILTVYRTARLLVQLNSTRANKGRSLMYVLLRDGIFYYAAIFLPSFAIVALDTVGFVTNSINITLISDDLALIVNALQVVIVNRLVLNLSHAGNAQEDSKFRTRTGRDAPVFSANTIVGNIGAPIRTLSDDTLFHGDDGLESKLTAKKPMRSDDLEAQHFEAAEDRIFDSSTQMRYSQSLDESSSVNTDWESKDLPARPAVEV